MSIEVVKVSPKEVALLQDISQHTFRDTYGHANTDQNMADYLKMYFNVERLTAELKHEEIYFYFAKKMGTILGYLKLNTRKSQTEIKDEAGLEIERIYVLPEAKGSGIGRRLCDEAVALAKQLQKKYVWLGVWEKNPKAIAFYEKYGFREFDRHTFVLGDEDQNDIMMKITIDA